MKRFALIAIVAVLAACGSDNNGPTDKFTGSWTGKLPEGGSDTLVFIFNSTQNGSAVTGSGTAAVDGNTYPMTFTGTSTPPSMSLAILITAGSPTALSYTGSYVTSDSISGTVTEGGPALALSLKKN